MKALSLQRGFTLLELIIVIAIIGILAAALLASMSDSRNKARDASIQSMVNDAHTTAQLFYSNNTSSFAGACTATDADNGGYTGNIDDKVAEFIQAIDVQYAAQTPSVSCFSDADEWVMESRLNMGGYYCVDAKDNVIFSPTSVIGNTDGDIDCT